jgi:resuscitation-promoting factor RpfA
MLTSGNGQHRRPRQAPRLVVAMGATGAGIAMPLLTSGAAHAASVSTWDKVAACESGGAWSANAGDGFYGGLALTRNVWEQYGGTAYADSPDLASRQEQIAVAQKILDDRGPGYWSGCAADAGLLQGGAAPDVDPGSPSPEPTTLNGLLGGLLSGTPSASGGSGAASATPAPTASDSPSPSGATAPPTASGSPDPAISGSASTAPSGSPTASASSPGRHAGAPASGTADDGGAPASGGAHARPRGAGSDGSRPGCYTVRPGDNLYEIAAEHALPGGWPALYGANRSAVGADPDLILPGEHLRLG